MKKFIKVIMYGILGIIFITIGSMMFIGGSVAKSVSDIKSTPTDKNNKYYHETTAELGKEFIWYDWKITISNPVIETEEYTNKKVTTYDMKITKRTEGAGSFADHIKALVNGNVVNETFTTLHTGTNEQMVFNELNKGESKEGKISFEGDTTEVRIDSIVSGKQVSIK